MAIRPISQTMPKQNNTINFEGNKKPSAQQTQTHSTPLTKAVPLAVLIAMSPLAMDAANNNRIEPEANNIEMFDAPELNEINQTHQAARIITSKNFKQVSDAQNLQVQLIEKNNKKSVRFVYTTPFGQVVTNKNQIVKYNYSIISDDGSKKTFSLKNAHSYTDKELKKTIGSPTPIIADRKDVIDYLEVLNKKYPGAVETIVYNRKLAPTSSGGIQNNARGDIMKNARPQASYGKNVGTQDFEGDNGKYTIRYYSKDGNDDNAEIITLQKEGYPELKTGIVVYHNAYVQNDTDLRIKLQYGQIQLIDANKKVYNIIDDSLTSAMALIKNELNKLGAFNNAYAVISLSSEYDITPKGAFYSVD